MFFGCKAGQMVFIPAVVARDEAHSQVGTGGMEFVVQNDNAAYRIRCCQSADGKGMKLDVSTMSSPV
ncbi:hypothetical protein VMCG_05631 [Cytospora schulzeri]|uniref:Uncharacterized protein n=1 Tax=Cytospora schulzeri TaxID=448051 RepID=A0A423WEQ7_9PEZI|nr:hypothetical protein VMCG_05631 [Valsa malicola]